MSLTMRPARRWGRRDLFASDAPAFHPVLHGLSFRDLTDHLAEFVDASVDSGRFQNAGEVVREALRLLKGLQRDHELKLEALRRAIALGLEDAANGRTKILEAGEIRGYLRGLGRTARA